MSRRVSAELLEKYRTSAPRYTSYPTAVDWKPESYEATGYADELAASAQRTDPISVYVHVPFCEQMCLYCGCNVVITRSTNRVDNYLDHLEREFERVGATGIGSRPVHQYHWGGGTPTHLSPERMQRLQRAFDQVFTRTHDGESAIEVDPRVTTLDHLDALADMGFGRISMGVQDFESDVQEASRRVQSVEQTRALVDGARARGMSSVNIDLMYGLPHQTRAGFRRTIDTVLDMRPERVALFHYAHVPWLKKHQTALDMDAAPSSEDKLEIFLDAIEAFTAAGYVYLGLDHFALPDDELALAARDEKLHRNFMGYTTHKGSEMVSLGVSAIGEVNGCFSQNFPNEGEYLAAIDSGGLASKRGHRMSDDDRLRRDLILGLMCNGVIDKIRLAGDHGIDFDAHFADELRSLEPMVGDGLVTLDKDAVRLTELGQLFMRNVALPFDHYFAARAERGKDGDGTFSKTL